MTNGQPSLSTPAKVHPAQQRCDAIQADYRADPESRPSIRLANPPAIDPALIPTEDQLRLRLAEEIEYARRLLNAMGDDLSADVGVVMRHMVALQSIDIVGQLLGHIAAVTRSSVPERAVERIGMGDLKARLLRKPL
ncbi:MAG TPA: hypothetical protein VGR05_09590 [Sphingomicrobium sp.]|nr:hypothetical protein [Sphingomicrobium sp.]